MGCKRITFKNQDDTTDQGKDGDDGILLGHKMDRSIHLDLTIPQ